MTDKKGIEKVREVADRLRPSGPESPEIVPPIRKKKPYKPRSGPKKKVGGSRKKAPVTSQLAYRNSSINKSINQSILIDVAKFPDDKMIPDFLCEVLGDPGARQVWVRYLEYYGRKAMLGGLKRLNKMLKKGSIFESKSAYYNICVRSFYAKSKSRHERYLIEVAKKG